MRSTCRVRPRQAHSAQAPRALRARAARRPSSQRAADASCGPRTHGDRDDECDRAAATGSTRGRWARPANQPLDHHRARDERAADVRTAPAQRPCAGELLSSASRSPEPRCGAPRADSRRPHTRRARAAGAVRDDRSVRAPSRITVRCGTCAPAALPFGTTIVRTGTRYEMHHVAVSDTVVLVAFTVFIIASTCDSLRRPPRARSYARSPHRLHTARYTSPRLYLLRFR